MSSYKPNSMTTVFWLREHSCNNNCRLIFLYRRAEKTKLESASGLTFLSMPKIKTQEHVLTWFGVETSSWRRSPTTTSHKQHSTGYNNELSFRRESARQVCTQYFTTLIRLSPKRDWIRYSAILYYNYGNT